MTSSAELMNRALSVAAGTDGDEAVAAIHDLVDKDGLPSRSLNVAEVADLLGISAHTVRYYERIGLVTVDRDQAGYRRYEPDTVRRLLFLTRMRLSGMPIRDLQRYVRMIEDGDSTVPERLALLLEHRDGVKRRIQELHVALAATEYKIARYGGCLGD